MSALLEFHNVTRRFRRTLALDDVSFSLPESSVTLLLGPNGAGKSTLLRLAHGLLLPDAGRIEVLGKHPIKNERAVRERVGWVPDHPDAPGWMTPRDLAKFLAPHYPTWDGVHMDALCERFGLPMDRALSTFSKGQGMKLMLAAALAPRPDLLLLDEPFSGLDPKAREELLAVLLEELAESGAGALVSTHDLDVAARLADRVLMFDQGRLTREASADELVQEHGQGERVLPALRGLFDEAPREEVVGQ